MPWSLIRLEHGPTSTFPQGSAIRAYLLRAPLQSNGHIDPELHAQHPLRATVRRFWPSEPDVSGLIIRNSIHWHFVSSIAGTETEIGSCADCAFEPGCLIEITEPQEGRLPFRVAAITRD